ncbi:MAG: polyprenyl diphosphate synthase [Patescibacteria group bacterium]
MAKTVVIPNHIGLILDGNRRWAKAQGLPNLEGHRIGYSNLKDIGRHAVKRGVPYISAYIFSAENWNRSKDEVKYLMDLALWLTTHELNEVNKDGIRVRFLGRRDGLSDKLVKVIQKAEELTKNNSKGTLALCFNYGGQQEIVDATNKLLKQAKSSTEITLEKFASMLYAPEIPPVDFIIRTSGEQRISNFMLWRAAYSELYFTDKHWPDFTTKDLDDALVEFAKRRRRFGA